MSNKFLIYTPNINFIPKNMEEVNNFAYSNNKFRIASVELNPHLTNVKVGDIVVTKKGNQLYILKTINTTIEEADAKIKEYINCLQREYGLKKMNITSVDSIIKYETWCKTAKFINPINFKENKMKKNSINNFSERLKEMFMPVEAKDIRISTDGNICVATNQGYVSINSDNELTSYVEELTLDLPVFIISKPKNQLRVGDVIALSNSYAKVIKLTDEKITAISYNGSGKTIHPVKDFLMNQTMVRVVVSLVGNLGGEINPMMLMLMSNKDDQKSILPLLMMGQNGSMLNMNPMMLMMLNKDNSDFSMKDMLMMSALSGNNMFSSMFQSPAVNISNKVTAKPVVEVVDDKTTEFDNTKNE